MSEGITIMFQNGICSYIPCIPGKTSDGYHTFDELYEHRCLLFAVLLKLCADRAWRSRLHHDGEAWEGWFIAGMDLPIDETSVTPITYHLPERLWDLLEGVPVREKAPEWDGHTSQDVLARLEAWISGINILYVFEGDRHE